MNKRLPIILCVVTCAVLALSFNASANILNVDLDVDCEGYTISGAVDNFCWYWHSGSCLQYEITVDHKDGSITVGGQMDLIYEGTDMYECPSLPVEASGLWGETISGNVSLEATITHKSVCDYWGWEHESLSISKEFSCLDDETCFGINGVKVERKDPTCKGITLMEVTSDQGTFVYQPEPDKDKLGAGTTVDDGVNGPQKIHTSCSQPLEVGDVVGAYTVTDLIKYTDVVGSYNNVKIKGTFVPAAPIDLATDEVIYTIDDDAGNTFTLTIPAGSFAVKGDPIDEKFEFKTGKGSVPEIKAKFDFRKCKFELSAKKVTDTSEITGMNLTVGLQAGINYANEVVEAEKQDNRLEYKAKPKQECCPKPPKCKGITLMEVTSNQGPMVFVPEEGKEKLSANTVVDDGVNGAVNIHTSCSQPIEVGSTFGAYTITHLVKWFK
jgi:hypothetical protein